MPKQLFVRHTYYTLNFQDGLAEDTRFETEAEARAAKKKYPMKGRGVCIIREHEDKRLEDCL